jgi:RNA-directed DNA polymerase
MSKNICLDKVIMDKWLKAGFIETGKLFPTTEGTPQGGIASPVMANIALDGMADMLKKSFPRQKGLHYIRYADDFIVTGHSKEVLEKEVKPAIKDFLRERGLELSEEKTKVTHITEGFDFLGQNVRKYPSQGKLKLLIKPSEKSIHSFLDGIRRIFRQARGITQADLIQILNPKIRGWANYHRSVVSKKTFAKIDNVIWHLTLGWAKRLHPNKSMNWILQHYYTCMKGAQYRFSSTEMREDGLPERHTLLLMAYTPIRRHVKILQSAHPFDTKYEEYFEKRIGEKWKSNSKRRNIDSLIAIAQKGKCPCCKEELKISQNWCISLKQKASDGGEYKPANADIIHKKCYEAWQSKRKHNVKPAADIKGGFERA